MNDAAKNQLWQQYDKTKNPQIKEQLIIEYAGLVKLVAGRLSMYLGNNVEFDDLTGYGVFGLIDAIDKFDYSKGIKFETYASLRIRGSILDNIRKMDWIPRSIRKKQKMIEAAKFQIENDSKENITDTLIAEELDISVEELYKWQDQTKALNLSSLEEFLEQGGEVTSDKMMTKRFDQPEKAIEEEEVKKTLIKAIEGLTEKEKKVITLYYYEELTLKEISLIMEVSESRISQLHTRSLKKMKEVLGNDVEIFQM
jgi:RNA polymerase sigma factor for flagellar operon FliA